jgi:hypothetical protein
MKQPVDLEESLGDDFFMMEALATAILALEQLSETRRPQRSIDRMKVILASRLPAIELTMFFARAKAYLRPDLDCRDVYREYGTQIYGEN